MYIILFAIVQIELVSLLLCNDFLKIVYTFVFAKKNIIKEKKKKVDM